MSSAEGTVVGRTLTLGRRLTVLPKIDSKGERLVVSRSGIGGCLDMRKVASPLCFFGVNIVVKALADSSDSGFCLAIGLVMVRGSQVEINFGVIYKLLPKAGGEPGVSIRDDRSRETMDREDSFNKNVSSFYCCDILRNWDEVGETS